MKTDRELLELAAKAAGHTIDTIDAMHEPDDWVCWNPLSDDGDALRLASELCIKIWSSVDYVEAEAIKITTYKRPATFLEQSGSDKHAATRRAITRAAAEIGAALDPTNGHQTPRR